LVASYSLVDGSREPGARLAVLIAMARPQIELLERRARTTHEGSSD